jgi:hypothetical protein
MERRQQKIEQTGHNTAHAIQGSSSNKFLNGGHGVKVRTGEDGYGAGTFNRLKRLRNQGPTRSKPHIPPCSVRFTQQK